MLLLVKYAYLRQSCLHLFPFPFRVLLSVLNVCPVPSFGPAPDFTLKVAAAQAESARLRAAAAREAAEKAALEQANDELDAKVRAAVAAEDDFRYASYVSDNFVMNVINVGTTDHDHAGLNPTLCLHRQPVLRE